MKTIKKKTEKLGIVVSSEGEMEGARRATGISPSDGDSKFKPPDPEVPEKKSRRIFTATYKLRILKETDTCTKPGQVGVILRREGLYSSNLTLWKLQRGEGILKGVSLKKRGRKNKEKNPLSSEVAQLQRENRKLQQKLKKAEAIIEVQKKISEILGITQNLDINEGSNS